MPRNYSPLNGLELGEAIINQLTKTIRQNPDIFGQHLTFRAFRFAIGVSIDFLDGRGEGASRTLTSPEIAQGDFAANLSDPQNAGKVWVGVGFSHPISLAPDQARAELHLPTHEMVVESGQMIEREVPPPFDPVLDLPSVNQQSQAAVPRDESVKADKQLTDTEISELFETPPPPRVKAPVVISNPATAIPQVAQLDPQRAAQLAAQARNNPPAAANNPFDKGAPIESRNVQNLRPRPPRQTPE